MRAVPDLSGALAGADALVSRTADEAHLVGVTAAVVSKQTVLWSAVRGVTDLDTGLPVNPQTLFRIGSVTKLFTGIAVMQLVENGLLSLDVSVNEHLRSYPLREAKGARPITVRDVMTHTSGLGEFPTLREILDDKTAVPAGQAVPTLAEIYPAGLQAEIPPGTKWAYSNHAIATLGQLVEDVTGQRYASYLAQHVFAPLGMIDTSLVRVPEHSSRLARPYAIKDGRPVPAEDLDFARQGSSTIFSTLADMIRFASALLNGGANDMGRVLAKASLDQMFLSHWTPDPRMVGAGLTFQLDEINGHRIVRHDGQITGYRSSLSVAPDAGVAALVLCNTRSEAPSHITAALMRACLDAPMDPASRSTRYSPALSGLTGVFAPTPGVLTNYRHWVLLGGELRVRRVGENLVASSPWGMLKRGVQLEQPDPSDPDRWQGRVGSIEKGMQLRLLFQRGPDGNVEAVAGRLGSPFRYRRRPAVRSLRILVPAVAAVVLSSVALAIWAVL